MYNYTFYLLLSILSDEEQPPGTPDDLGNQFTEIFIKKGDNVGLLLSLLDVSAGKSFPHVLEKPQWCSG